MASGKFRAVCPVGATPAMSPRRRPGSILTVHQNPGRNCQERWIPAFAGMTSSLGRGHAIPRVRQHTPSSYPEEP
jgi:hypothetical protein